MLHIALQVDTDELERIAVSIAQNAVIETENSEAVSRLNMTASAIESDNMDPLGFGRVDTRVLALVSSQQWAVSSSWRDLCQFLDHRPDTHLVTIIHQRAPRRPKADLCDFRPPASLLCTEPLNI